MKTDSTAAAQHIGKVEGQNQTVRLDLGNRSMASRPRGQLYQW
jgi:hypothetical protein